MSLAGAPSEQWNRLRLEIQATPNCQEPAEAHVLAPLDVPGLTKLMVKGDEKAYHEFYESYFDRLLRYLLVVTRGDENSSREALQATLVRVVRHIRVFPNDTVFWSWLTVLARSALADQTRKSRRYLGFLDRFMQNPLPEASEATENEDEQLFTSLERNLSALAPDELDLLQRKYFAGQSVRLIADGLQTTEKSIESRLVRIRRKLKVSLMKSLKNE